MRHDPEHLHQQRLLLDAKLASVGTGLAQVIPPRGGWLKAVRESLGMAAEQLGLRLGVTKQTVLAFERNEAHKTLTLESLERAAQAMGCRLVYAVVPEQSLEAQLDAFAEAAARKKLARVSHSMALEDQPVPPELHELQVKTLAQKLKASLSPDLWR